MDSTKVKLASFELYLYSRIEAFIRPALVRTCPFRQFDPLSDIVSPQHFALRPEAGPYVFYADKLVGAASMVLSQA